MTYQFRCVNGECDAMGEVKDKEYKVQEVGIAKPTCNICGTIMQRVYSSFGLGTSDNFKRSV